MKNFVLILSIFVIAIWSCRDCAVSSITTVQNLNNGVMVVSYLGDCGATVDMDANVSVCMTNDDLQNLGNRTGNVFFAYHARGVTVTKVSPDTVKIIYAASEVRTMRYYVNGVNFVYEENWKYFH